MNVINFQNFVETFVETGESKKLSNAMTETLMTKMDVLKNVRLKVGLCVLEILLNAFPFVGMEKFYPLNDVILELKLAV